MGRLIAVVGNSGVGKTTLARQLCRLGDFSTGLEQHEERPFQRLFAAAEPFSMDHQFYAFANQLDYLLLRAEQELAIRRSFQDGIVDGGLEVDFYIFTHLFHQKGYLGQAAFQLCERTYHLLRQLLPAPDLLIYLDAPLEVIARRFEQRGRALEIARLADLQAMQALLTQWLEHWSASPVFKIDASIADPDYAKTGPALLANILRLPVSAERSLT